MTTPRAPECERIPGPPATPKQRQFLRRVHQDRWLDISATARRRFGVAPRDLTAGEASALIDEALRWEDWRRRFPAEFDRESVERRS